MPVQFEARETVGLVTIDRPQALNSFSAKTAAELEQVLERCYEDEQVRAVVLTGAGDRAFCTGADISTFLHALDNGNAPEAVAEVSGRMNEVIAGIVEAPTPVVAAINGTAAGGGLGLALACDLRVASQTSRFLTAFMNVAVAPDGGTTWLLPRTVGWARARELLLTNPLIDAREALEMGLVTELVPSDRTLDRGLEVARELASNPGQVMAWTKERMAHQRPLREHLSWEREATVASAERKNFEEGIRAFFDKREPVFE